MYKPQFQKMRTLPTHTLKCATFRVIGLWPKIKWNYASPPGHICASDSKHMSSIIRTMDYRESDSNVNLKNGIRFTFLYLRFFLRHHQYLKTYDVDDRIISELCTLEGSIPNQTVLYISLLSHLLKKRMGCLCHLSVSLFLYVRYFLTAL